MAAETPDSLYPLRIQIQQSSSCKPYKKRIIIPNKPLPPTPKTAPASSNNSSPTSFDFYRLPTPKSPHPTIGAFFSARARKKKWKQRELPSKPQDICVYFVLLGKIYKYTINMRLEHKLYQMLPKLSQALTANDEILSIITAEIAEFENKRDRNSSTLSTNSNMTNDDNIESNHYTHDLIIVNPIFIYEDIICDRNDNLIDIGYKTEMDRIAYNNQNDEHRTPINLLEKPYIIILSCKKKKVTKPSSSRNSFTFSFKKDDHIRSFTQNDVSFIPSLNMLSFERYNDLKDCVSNFGDSGLITSEVTEEELLEFINDSVEKYVHVKSQKDAQQTRKSEKNMAVPHRKRSRARSMLVVSDQPKFFDSNSEIGHYPGANSMSPVSLNGIHWMNSYSQSPTFEPMISPKSPTLLMQSISPQALSIPLINEQKEDDIIVVIEDDDVPDDVVSLNIKSIKKKKDDVWSRKELLKMSKPKLIKLCKKYLIPVATTNTKHDMIERLMNVSKNKPRRKTVIAKHTHFHPMTTKNKNEKHNKRGAVTKQRPKSSRFSNFK